ncbi:MAG: hypothetical protein JW850_07420 [Thermoflexales bacterium]|nr:hypothetical protein [Thermoflexales bacterium]
MPESKNYTELTHQVVRESPDPLPLDEIVRRVHAIEPITTRNPSSTIRGAVGQTRLIVATGDGRYGYKPRLMSGSSLRHNLSKSDLAGYGIGLGMDIREALWPAFFELAQKRTDQSPINLGLPGGIITRLPIAALETQQWGTPGTPEFWEWFAGLGAVPVCIGLIGDMRTR